jgi:hypothetical protein
MSMNIAVVALCALTLGVTCFVAASLPKGGDDRVAELEKKLAAAEARAEAAESMKSQVREMETRLGRRLDDLDRRVAVSRTAPGAAAAPVDGRVEAAAADAGKPFEEIVAERVEKKLAERMEAIAGRDKERGEDGKWKAPIDELAAELKLTDAQKTEAKRIFDAAHDESYLLLKAQRLDGGSLLDDLVASLKGGTELPEAVRQLFSRIVTEKVPGTDRTYLAEYVTLEKGVQDQLASRLDKDQMKRLATLRVSILEVKTGHDPVGDYVRARLQ